MEVYLDGRALDSREALHQALSALLAFPAYYGKNLDALHDCLTDGAFSAYCPTAHKKTSTSPSPGRNKHAPDPQARRSGAFLQLYGS